MILFGLIFQLSGMVKELREQLDFGQLVEPMEETKTLLAEIHKGQGDSLKDIRAASRQGFGLK